jgi:hypothetical protein
MRKCLQVLCVAMTVTNGVGGCASHRRTLYVTDDSGSEQAARALPTSAPRPAGGEPCDDPGNTTPAQLAQTAPGSEAPSQLPPVLPSAAPAQPGATPAALPPADPSRPAQQPGDGPVAADQGTATRDAAAAPASLASHPAEPAAPGEGQPARRLVKSDRFRLRYHVRDVGPSGVSEVELWYTKDGGPWSKCGDVPPDQDSCMLRVEGEGLYGFTLVARNGHGLSGRPPGQGEAPQFVVEVDQTRPVVEAVQVAWARDGEKAGVRVAWTASDKNLAPHPISLYYAASEAGPWSVIARGLDNAGRYAWQPPPGLPSQCWVRVEALDAAGNVGVAEVAVPPLDTQLPAATVLDADEVGP